jgi:hypothetical protein
METRLTTGDLTQLLTYLRGTQVSPVDNIRAGIVRIRQLLQHEIGSTYNDDVLKGVLEARDYHEARDRVEDALAPVNGWKLKVNGAPTMAKAKAVEEFDEGAAPVEPKVKKTRAKKEPSEPKAEKSLDGGRRGRESIYAGKFLYPLVENNVRREGVPGHHSLGLILSKPGITTAEYLEQGGRLEDLRWDHKHDHIEICDEKK